MPTRFPGLLVASVTLAALGSACAKSPTRPPVTDVRLSLSVEPSVGGPSDSIAITVTIVNAGHTRVWYYDGCGCGIGLSVLGPDGALVALHPWSPPPLCPCGPVPFEPGEVLGGGGMIFDGTLYEVGVFPSAAYAAPAGTYTVIATFSYATSAGGQGTQLTRELEFDWRP